MISEEAVAQFVGSWPSQDQNESELTDTDKQFITAAISPEPANRWEGDPDVEQMEKIVRNDPTVLERIGPHLIQKIATRRGCGPAVEFLLDHDVPFKIDEKAYNVLHEAAWAGAVDTLQTVFESSAADATSVAVLKPHVG